jgi:hypothetical protein
MPYNMPQDWTVSGEQTYALSHLCFSVSAKVAIPHTMAKWKPGLAAQVDSAGRAAVAEIEEFSLEEILHALRATYGAKPDPTRRLELLQDSRGKLRETVSLRKACEYAARTPRRIKQLIADGKVETRGAKGNRRILVADLIRYYPPEK